MGAAPAGTLGLASPGPPVTTRAPDTTATAVPIAIPAATGITTGNDLMPFIIPTAPSPPHFPMEPFTAPLSTTRHFDLSEPFPTISDNLFNDAQASGLPPGTFDPYPSTPYITGPILSPPINHTAVVGPPTVQGSTTNADRLKRSRLQGTSSSEGGKQPKCRRTGTTAKQAVGEQEPIYRGFTVGRGEVNESAKTTDPLWRPPGITDKEYFLVLKSRRPDLFPGTSE